MSSRNPVHTTAIACAAMALAAALAALFLGYPRPGLALGAGLVIGASNGVLAQRALALGGAFRLTSLLRLGVLSVAGIGAGLLIGIDVAWLAAVGLGVAQFVLSASAAREAIRR